MVKDLCEKNGMRRQLIIPGTLQQNGLAEPRNRTLLDIVRLMMAHANVSISFSGDALLMTVCILNHVPIKSVSVTPYELWYRRKPSLAHLHPWGSADYVHNPTHRHGKLGLRATKILFTWYPKHSKGYIM